MPRASKFQGIFDATRGQDAAAVAEPEPDEPAVVAETPPARKPGRPAVGKKSDPAYAQVTAYVRKDRYRDVRIALLQDGDGRDFSGLVDGLLADWLDGRQAGPLATRPTGTTAGR